MLSNRILNTARQVHRDNLHKVVAAHRAAFHAWMLSEIRQVLDEKIMNLKTGIRFADQKVLVLQVCSTDRSLCSERMARRQDREDLFDPKMFGFTTCRRSLACEKRDIDPKASNSGNVLAWSSFEIFDMNTSFTAFISLEQIRDKAGCKG